MLASDTGQRMSALHSPLEYDVVFDVEACDGRTIMQQMIRAAIVVIRQEMIARLPCIVGFYAGIPVRSPWLLCRFLPA